MRIWRSWPRRHRTFRFPGVVFSVFLGVGLALLLIFQLNARLRPVLLDVAETQTSNRITAAINDAATIQAMEYTDLVTLERDATGGIIALTSNMAQVNALRTDLLSAALGVVEGSELQELGIPLGTLSGFDLFSGRGPDILVKVISVGAAHAEFENEFTAAGINQTCHRIFFDVCVDVAILLPGTRYHTTVSTRICVAETVIVGQVPETHLQFGV